MKTPLFCAVIFNSKNQPMFKGRFLTYAKAYDEVVILRQGLKKGYYVEVLK